MTDIGKGGGQVQGEFVWTLTIFGDLSQLASVCMNAKGHRKE